MKSFHSLNRVLVRLLVWRLFAPGLVLGAVAIGLLAYMGKGDLEVQQQTLARALARRADDYLDHAGRMLDAVARVAETEAPQRATGPAAPGDKAAYMQATWAAYGYFDVLYRLDENGVVIQLAPSNSRYLGIDMSRQPYFQTRQGQTDIVISSPFISLHTGQPTVYVTRPLKDGGLLVGELGLGALQEAVTDEAGEKGAPEVFIIDRDGTLLGHSHPERVARQENVGHLEIVQRGIAGEDALIFSAGGTWMLGGVAPVARSDWLVVAQLSLTQVYGPYLATAGLYVAFMTLMGLVVLGYFQRQLRRRIVDPLAQLSRGTGTLAAGDFGGQALMAFPAAFAEVETLAADFRRMSQALQEREAVLETHRRFLAGLNEITRGALEMPDLQTMLQNLADKLGELFDADGCYITRWDEASGATLPIAAYAPFRESYLTVRADPEDVTLTASALQAGRPLAVKDVFNTPYLSRRIAEKFPVRSALALPLIADGRKMGAALIAFNAPHRFTTEQVVRGEQVAGQIALAVAKVQALEEAQARWHEAETLRKAMLALTTALDLDHVIDRILAQLQAVVPYDTATVQLLRGSAEGQSGVGYLEIVGGRGFPNIEHVLSLSFPIDGDNPNREVVRTQAPFIVADCPAAYEAFQRDPHVAAGTRSWLGAPMLVGGQMTGMIVLDKREPGFYTQAHSRLALAFATQAAIAIENARLYHKSLDRADQLEQRVRERTVELQTQYARLDAILHSVGDAILMTDQRMQVQYINPAFTTLTGYTAEDVLGLHADGMGMGAQSKRVRQSIMSVLAEGRAWQGEIIHRRKDGRTYDAALTIAPVRDADKLLGYVSSHRDITHLKDLDRVRSQFITNVSHALRTPVTNLKLYTRLLQGGASPEKAGHYLHVLDEQVERLNQLVQDILEIVVLDSGQAVTAWEPLALPTIIDQVVTGYQNQVQASGLKLVVAPLPPDLPAVSGDPIRLTQALKKLMKNAVTFTPAGGQVTVEVQTVEAKGQHWVTLALRDTGPGLTPQEQAHVFDRFFRGRTAESGHILGTGLGLSIAQEILRAHGGRITLESELGQGSTFIVWLPVV